MTGRRKPHEPASETFIRCKRHDTLPDENADMGRGCILYDDHEAWHGVGCHIGDIPRHLISLPEEAHAPDCVTDRKWSAEACGCLESAQP